MKKPLMTTEVIENSARLQRVLDNNKETITVFREQLLNELSESRYSISGLTYSDFIEQAVDRIILNV